jgi:alkylation response protein AidB-like acyl-CoA dehydrogenase
MLYTEIDEQVEFRASIRAFIAKEAPPGEINQWENTATFPAELYKKMAGLGWLGIAFPEKYGGSGAGPNEVCALGEELARRAGYELASGLGLPLFGGLTILENGSDLQRATYLPQVSTGDLRFCVAYTEPDAGSDAASIRTAARAQSNGTYVVSGHKVFVSAAGHPNTVMLVTVRTDPSAERHNGMSLVLIRNDAPGVRIERLPAMGRDMLGFNNVFFDDVVITADDVVGEINNGWNVLGSGLSFERLFTSSAYVGAAQCVVDEALSHAKTRMQFGRAIGEYQAIAHLLAEMQTRVDAARGLLYRAVTLLDRGEPCRREVSEAKLFGSETFVRVAGDGIQIMGAQGYLLESSMQRHFRDARSTTIAAGTSQIHRTVIARALGLGVR